MIDIKDYLEQTNTILLTKDTFKYLKDCADIVTKIRNGVPREDLGFPVSAEFYNAIFGIPIEKLNEFEDAYQYYMKKNFGIDESEDKYE